MQDADKQTQPYQSLTWSITPKSPISDSTNEIHQEMIISGFFSLEVTRYFARTKKKHSIYYPLNYHPPTDKKRR
jgi:hypothetical protein